MESEYDIIVVGSGIGGSTVAREMALRGKKTLLIERGGRTNMMGNTFTAALVLKKMGLTRSKEKYTITFADNYGGLSTLSAGCAVPPPKMIFDPVGIDLTKEVEEAGLEMGVQKLPDELIGQTNLRLLDGANNAGYSWDKIDNFIDAQKCTPDCSACMLGCKRNAKFTARNYGNEAIKNGADLALHTTIKEIVIDNGKAIGVRGRRLGRTITYHSKIVVLSAGMDNVHMLRHAGISEAGRGFCCDWLQFVGGIIPGLSTSKANPMTVGTMENYESDGFSILPVFPNWAMFGVVLGYMGARYIPRVFNHSQYTGIMVKVRDETSGEILKGTSFSKPVTKTDQQKLDKGIDIIKKILKSAGAKEDSIIPLKPSGAHPSATCRIGEVVDNNLETSIENLYCCDASVFPSSLGLPVVWTVASLGKRLANHLSERLEH